VQVQVESLGEAFDGEKFAHAANTEDTSNCV
jgi:hypothetical protein